MDCFYLPKTIMTAEYSSYSSEAKLLFAMLLSNSTNATAITTVAKLIDELGAKKINTMYKDLQKTIAESESA